MFRVLGNWRLGAVVLVIAIVLVLPSGVEASAAGKSDDDIPDGWLLMPRIGLGLSYGGFVVQQDNFCSQSQRRVEIDLIQYRRHILYMNFSENIFYGIPSSSWTFNLMKFNIAEIGYRYDFGSWYLGLVYNHECNNPFQTRNYQTYIDRSWANYYAVGVEAQSKAMRLGMEDRNIDFAKPEPFEFLGDVYGSALVSGVTSSEYTGLKFLLTAKARWDILRYRIMVPYLEAGASLLTGQAVRVVPTVELGTRLHFSRVEVIPFFLYGRYQEFLLENWYPKILMASKYSLLGGLRLEALLDTKYLTTTPHDGGLQFMPEIHGTAAYGLHFPQTNFKGYGNIELDLEVLRLKPWTIFFYTDMYLNTWEKGFRPNKLVASLQYGLTYEKGNYFAEGFVKNAERLDARIFRGTQERFNLAGLRMGTKAMKPGQVDYGIDFSNPDSFQWLNRWNGQVSAGHFFQNLDWQYLWEISSKIRWDLLRYYFVIPYVQGELTWSKGGGSTSDAWYPAVESGFRLHGVLDLLLYYRFEHSKDALFFRGGPTVNLNTVGIRAMF